MINVLIIDSDYEYVEALRSFFEITHKNKFNISHITSFDFFSFQEFNFKKIDILLVSSDYYDEAMKYSEKVGTIVLLSNDLLLEQNTPVNWIYKYKDGNTIANSLIDIFIKKNTNVRIISKDDKKSSNVISVFSSAGGTGKTTISLALSILSAKRGFRALYINLENIQSTSIFLQCTNQKNLSHLILTARLDKNSSNQSIEAFINTDVNYNNICYFSPIEYAIDMEGVTAGDIYSMLNKIKESGKFDMVFIDMSNELSCRNISVMKSSDNIILVTIPELFYIEKHKYLLKQLEISCKEEYLSIINKSQFIINKHIMGKEMLISEFDFENIGSYIKLPEVNNILAKQNGKLLINLSNDFGNSVNDLLNYLIRGDVACGSETNYAF